MLKMVQILFVTFLLTSSAYAHEHGHDDAAMEDVTIENLTEGLDMIQAGGGNIAVLHGDEGVFVIDNGLPDKTETVMEAIHKVAGDKDVKILVNTHWHFDHTGNNAALGEAGTVIIAHDNVRERLQKGQVIKGLDKEVKPAAAAALPVLTYDTGVNVHLNGHSAQIVKMPAAHTDGDSVIYWKEANIIHTGDIFFNGKFPFIDGSSGGSLRGMIEATNKIIEMTNDATKIIPGHGALANKADLLTYNAMLKDIAMLVEKAKKQGTREDWIQSYPLQNWNNVWGGGFMSVEKFTEIVWDSY